MIPEATPIRLNLHPENIIPIFISIAIFNSEIT